MSNTIPSNITSTFDMLVHALTLSDTMQEGYIYVQLANTLAWSYLNNTKTIQNLNDRRQLGESIGRSRLNEAQFELLNNLERDIPETEALLSWVHYEALKIRESEVDYGRTCENVAGWAPEGELKAKAEQIYGTLPDAERFDAINNYVSAKNNSCKGWIEQYEKQLELVTGNYSDTAIEPNLFITKFLLNSIHRNMIEYTTAEGITAIADRVGFDDQVTEEHILRIPNARFAIAEIDKMLMRIDESLEQSTQPIEEGIAH